MITRYNINNENNNAELMDFLRKKRDFDFYYTLDNERRYINSKQDLKNLVKDCVQIWMMRDIDIQGIAAVWLSKIDNIKRPYVKITAETKEVAEQLLDVVIWNYNRDLYVKFNKKNRFLKSFYRKGFKFKASRGIQVLLCREYRRSK